MTRIQGDGFRQFVLAKMLRKSTQSRPARGHSFRHSRCCPPSATFGRAKRLFVADRRRPTMPATMRRRQGCVDDDCWHAGKSVDLGLRRVHATRPEQSRRCRRSVSWRRSFEQFGLRISRSGSALLGLSPRVFRI